MELRISRIQIEDDVVLYLNNFVVVGIGVSLERLFKWL